MFTSILAGTNELLTMDLPGHGENAQISGSLDEIAQMILSSVPDEEFVLGGYSFGGRTALHVALAAPERVRGLVLLSATRGIHDEIERVQRRDRDNQLANHIEDVGASQFLEEWLSQPMFASLPHDPTERHRRSTNASGLANSLRYAGTGTQRWLGDDVELLTMPALCMAGEMDHKFTAEAHALSQSMPHAALRILPGLGHAAHLEDPQTVAQVVDEFIEGL